MNLLKTENRVEFVRQPVIKLYRARLTEKLQRPARGAFHVVGSRRGHQAVFSVVESQGYYG